MMSLKKIARNSRPPKAKAETGSKSGKKEDEK
jgi:hypothetical protein